MPSVLEDPSDCVMHSSRPCKARETSVLRKLMRMSGWTWRWEGRVARAGRGSCSCLVVAKTDKRPPVCMLSARRGEYGGNPASWLLRLVLSTNISHASRCPGTANAARPPSSPADTHDPVGRVQPVRFLASSSNPAQSECATRLNRLLISSWAHRIMDALRNKLDESGWEDQVRDAARGAFQQRLSALGVFPGPLKPSGAVRDSKRANRRLSSRRESPHARPAEPALARQRPRTDRIECVLSSLALFRTGADETRHRRHDTPRGAVRSRDDGPRFRREECRVNDSTPPFIQHLLVARLLYRYALDPAIAAQIDREAVSRKSVMLYRSNTKLRPSRSVVLVRVAV